MLGSAWRRLYRREWFFEAGLSYPDEEKVMLEGPAREHPRACVRKPHALFKDGLNPLPL